MTAPAIKEQHSTTRVSDLNESDFTDTRAKHLEMIQRVIERMAVSATWMKRLAIVVVGGAAALAAKGDVKTGDVSVLATLLVVIFWYLDARYHQRECWFRGVFEAVRAEPHDMRPDFRIMPSDAIRARHSFWGSAFSWSSCTFYLALTVFLVIAWGVSR